jgi:hypothetical protein
MESRPSHEAGGTGTVTRIHLGMIANARESLVRTLTALIHSAFSLVLNVLHSFRTTGFVQGPLPKE